MRPGRLNFGHMTRTAIPGTDTTARVGRLDFCLNRRLLSFSTSSMTRQTLVVIKAGIVFGVLVGIMTCNATYPFVIGVTFALEDAVRLKSDVVNLHTSELRKLLIPAMTGSAKILRYFIAAEPCGVE